MAKSWLEKNKAGWSDIHYQKSLRAFERDVLPAMGRLPIEDITAAMVVAVVRPIASRGARETAGRILQHIGGVFRFAEALGLVDRGPSIAAGEVLPKQKMAGRRPALLDFPALRDVLRRADIAAISPSVRIAQRLSAFSTARIGNVVEARWEEFDLDGDTPTWRIPRANMKAKERYHDHSIVLGPTIAAELRAWRDLTGGNGYVFPSPAGNAHITRESLEKLYRNTLNLSGTHTIHGWRAAFATLARDEGYAREVVELTLDHIHDTAVARAYDRGDRLEERKRLMAWWDEQLSASASAAKSDSAICAGAA